MPIYSGSTKIDELHIDGVKVGEAYIWNGSTFVKVYASATPIVPMGLRKTANQSVGSAWVEITLVDDPNYPDTVRSGNGIVVSGSGLAQIIANGNFSQSFYSNGIRILVNGTVVSERQAAATPLNITEEFELSDGDIVTIEGRSSYTLEIGRAHV